MSKKNKINHTHNFILHDVHEPYVSLNMLENFYSQDVNTCNKMAISDSILDIWEDFVLCKDLFSWDSFIIDYANYWKNYKIDMLKSILRLTISCKNIMQNHGIVQYAVQMIEIRLIKNRKRVAELSPHDGSVHAMFSNGGDIWQCYMFFAGYSSEKTIHDMIESHVFFDILEEAQVILTHD
jgi:hypothetical protein